MELKGQINNYVVIPKEEFQKLLDKIDLLLKSRGERDGILSDYYTQMEVMDELGIRLTSLWELRKSGRLKYYKIGKKNFYKKADVIKLIENSKGE